MNNEIKSTELIDKNELKQLIIDEPAIRNGEFRLVMDLIEQMPTEPIDQIILERDELQKELNELQEKLNNLRPCKFCNNHTPMGCKAWDCKFIPKEQHDVC